MNIHDFKKGDAVVRVGPSKGIGDRSYIGDKLILVGISNGCAYFDREDNTFEPNFMDKRIRLRLDWWDEEWQYYQEIDDETPKDKLKYNLVAEIRKAIENEDYELLQELQNIFNENTK